MIDWAKGRQFSPMAHSLALPRMTHTRLLTAIIALAGLALVFVVGRALLAQVEGERGIAPVVASSDIDVGGIEVDVTAKTADEARELAWQEAQRKAWAKIGGPAIPDSQLQSLVSAMVIEREQMSSTRYIARLGVIFDRARASRFIGAGGAQPRSAPMLLIPVTMSAGSEMVYEMRNPWQRAWAEFQAGASRVDYVRPSGAGGDSLLVTYGQTGRRSRTWWRNVLDQFGAADVLVPIAHLQHRWPGGPIDGTFTARYGPDNTYLASFSMTADSDQQLPEMLNRAVTRFDSIFEQALADGKLKPDPTLSFNGGSADPALQQLIELGRRIAAQDRAAAEGGAVQAGDSAGGTDVPTSGPAAVVSSFVVQFASPDAGAVDATLATVRATSGVRGAATTSIAIGGTSVMSVTYAGTLDQLAAALRARGFSVNQGSNALAISR